ncbi:MAG: hypothetical protein HN390_01925 [Anaerolineae bacterium]|nr:hypothetical protein [Anaerolineae bacterium]MBT7189075.1 hypothetical protein [Anaerolineae bacterium]MBT7990348.1 hypothetical protein [Anaerolineae bacterium]
MPFLVSSTATLIIFLLLQEAFSEGMILVGIGVGDGGFVVSETIVVGMVVVGVTFFVGVDGATVFGNSV